MSSVNPGDLLLHYRMIEPVGSGGMGMVWKALDTRLQREVAIKFVHSDVLQDPAAEERFAREARFASALNHPNIVTIHDINADQGVHFIVMECVKGTSLRDMLRAGRLSVADALSYGLQIGDALGQAHAAGIVHRDLKPANVMITESGRVKVLDFGLAKLLEPAHADMPEETITAGLTIAGNAVGTVGYMSPEQAMGGIVDARSDVFSFGILLYEMFAGVLPFPGANWSEFATNLLHRKPPALRDTVPGVSQSVSSAVDRCLTRDRDLRYPTCEEAVRGLQSAPGAATLSARHYLKAAITLILIVSLSLWMYRQFMPHQRGIAILPFTSLSADPEARAFSAGLVTTLSNSIGSTEEFQKSYWIVPAADVQQVKAQTAKDASQYFNADLAIGGSIQRSGELIRVTITLTDTKTHRQISLPPITKRLADSFAIEDELVRGVTAQLLHVDLQTETRDAIRTQGSHEPDAEDYYLQARGSLDNGAGQVDAAIELFEQALKRDPKLARAHAGLAQAYLRKFTAGHEPEFLDKARSSSEEALRLRPALAEAQITGAMVQRAQGRYPEAISVLNQVAAKDPRNREAWMRLGEVYESSQNTAAAQAAYQKAVALQPAYPMGHQRLGVFYLRTGRYPEAEKSFLRAQELAPASHSVFSELGALYLEQARYPEAEAALKKSLSFKETAAAYNNLSSCYSYQERYAEAVPMMEKALQLGQRNAMLLGNLGDMYRRVGMKDKAGVIDQQAIQLAMRDLTINPHDAESRAELAWLYAENNNHAAAVGEIEEALRQAPTNGTVLFRAVLTYEMMGERKRAIEVYESLRRNGAFLQELRRRPELKAFRSDPAYKEK